MTTYTVHHPAKSPAEIIRHCEATEFVKDGFCWPGLLVPPVWMLGRHLWLGFAGYIATVIVLLVIASVLALSDQVFLLLVIALSVVVGFEGNNFRRWTLRRHGLSDVGVVIEKPLIDAERRFFQGLLERKQPLDAPAPRPEGPSNQTIQIASALSEPDDMVGLFPAPGAKA